MTDPLTGSAAHGLAMQPPSVVLESIIVAIQQPPRWILKVVRGPSKFEWREAKIGISASPRGLSVTETRYEHGFTSPSPWWRPTDATRRRWSAPFSRPPPVAGGPARRGRSSVGGGRRWPCGRRDGGGAPGWQRDAVHTGSDGQRRRAESMVIATASWVAGGPARRGRSSVGGGRRWRCARRAGGGAPGWPCASIHCDSMAQRRDGGVLAVAPPSGG